MESQCLRWFWLWTVLTTLLACAAGQPAQESPPNLSAANKAFARGSQWYQKGCYTRALEDFRGAHERFAVTDDLAGTAKSLNAIGNVYRHAGDRASALLFLEESIALYRLGSDNRGLAQAHLNRAAVLMDQDQLDEAQLAMESASRTLGEDNRLALIYRRSKGVLLTRQGEFSQAESLLREALDMVTAEEVQESAAIHYSLGKLLLTTQRPDMALEHLNQALQTDREQGFHRRVADDLTTLAEAMLARERPQEAAAALKRGLKIYALLGDADKAEVTLERLQPLAVETGTDLRVTKHFVSRWLAGDTEEGICR